MDQPPGPAGAFYLYLADHQFLLHKEDYHWHFGPNSKRLTAAETPGR